VNSFFKTRDEVEEYLSGDKIECLLCGKSFVALGQHIVKAHDISLHDYKVHFNIPHSYSLIGISFKNYLQKKNKNNPWLAKMIKAGKKKSTETGRKQAKPTQIQKKQMRLNARNARRIRALKNAVIKVFFPCRICGKLLSRTLQTKNPICKKCENKEQYAKKYHKK
jgi:hypothetical protein